FVSENAESLKRDPLIARHVRSGIYSLLFNQLVEFLFGTLEGHDIFRRPFQDHHRKHLAGDLENKVVAPLHVLSRVRKREAIDAHRFTIHFTCPPKPTAPSGLRPKLHSRAMKTTDGSRRLRLRY